MLVARARDRRIDRFSPDLRQVHLHLQPLQARVARSENLTESFNNNLENETCEQSTSTK
jgi:hypothetical protein